VEGDRFERLEAAVDAGRLVPARPTPVLWLKPANAPTATPAALYGDGGGCVFFDAAGGRLCQIHRTLGHGSLPLACREFPRVSVVDPRGTSVTLSHFCPTAAGLLESDEPIAIVTDGHAFPKGTSLTGLDVRSELPPLLRPDMLMAWDVWWDVERRAVDLLTRPHQPAAEGLRTLADAVDRMSTWTPSDGPLGHSVDEAFRRASARGNIRIPDDRWVADVLAAVPEELRPFRLYRPGRPDEPVVQRFLAAHAFASWIAHLGRGLHAWLASLQAAQALIEAGLGVRQADLLLRHLADPRALAETFSADRFASARAGRTG
jgi:hypothetical protein